MIFGLPGAGKSTFAIKLAQVLSLPYYSIDKYYWKPLWGRPNLDEWLAIHQQLIDKSSWLIDGCAIKSSFMERYESADVAIYFKYSRLICLWRMIKRCFLKKSSIHLPKGCVNGVPWRLIEYMWTFDRTRMQPLLPEAQVRYPHVQLYVVHNDKEAQRLLATLAARRRADCNKNASVNKN